MKIVVADKSKFGEDDLCQNIDNIVSKYAKNIVRVSMSDNEFDYYLKSRPMGDFIRGSAPFSELSNVLNYIGHYVVTKEGVCVQCDLEGEDTHGDMVVEMECLPKDQDEVEFPSGKGKIIVGTPDTKGIIIVKSTDTESYGEYKRVALSAIKR
jgi:hypothetical protein